MQTHREAPVIVPLQAEISEGTAPPSDAENITYSISVHSVQ